MNPKVESITDPIKLGEGPFWDTSNQCLYFVDTDSSGIHKYDTRTNEHFWATVGNEPVSIIIPIQDKSDYYVIGYGNDIASLYWDGVSKKVHNLQSIARIDERPGNRLNDGKIGPAGELFIGSTGRVLPTTQFDRRSSLYFYKDGVVKELFGDVGISNGLAWRSDQKYCYYVDTCREEVTCYDYDSSADIPISNGRTLFNFVETNTFGCPDGMTIDATDKLWVANYEGSEIVRIDPEVGKLIDRVPIPSAHVTSVTFGGPYLDELYVTTALCDTLGRKDQTHEYSGCLFRVTGVGVKGTENYRMVI